MHLEPKVFETLQVSHTFYIESHNSLSRLCRQVVVMQKYEEFIRLQGSMAHVQSCSILDISFIRHKKYMEHVGHIYFRLFFFFFS